MTLAIINVEYIKDYKIRLVLSGDEEKIIDFEPFLKLAGILRARPINSPILWLFSALSGSSIKNKD